MARQLFTLPDDVLELCTRARTAHDGLGWFASQNESWLLRRNRRTAETDSDPTALLERWVGSRHWTPTR